MKSFNSRFLCILAIVLFAFSQYATAQTHLSGIVKDAQNAPLAYANVLLINPIDSSLILGNITNDDGSYMFEKVQPGDYQISISMLGYQDQYSDLFTLTSTDSEYVISSIQMQEATALLNEVEVVEKRVLFEQKIDRLVVNVDNTIALTGTSALEVLKRSPGVAVNPQSNSISMSGKDGVVVMINGKISRMPMDAVVQMLGGMNSDNIEKIELIHTPPANFDAQGNAGFINIVLKKNQDEGINGGFTLSAGYGQKEKAGTSINLNYRKNKINIFGDYSWKYNNNPQQFNNYRAFERDGILIENDGRSTRNPTRTHVQNARIGIDYNLSDKTIIGALVSFTDSHWKMDAINTILALEDNVLINRLSIPNDEINHNRSYVGNINLNHRFSKNQSINVDIDYANFYNNNPSNYHNQYFDSNDVLVDENKVRVSKQTPLDILVGKIDFTQNIGEKIKLELGLKGTASSFDNDVLVENQEGDTWVKAPKFSSEAMMNENVAAAYSAFTWKANDKTDVKAGLRYEFADIQLGTVEEPNIVDRMNGRFFPSLFISNQINENNKVQVSYTRRINRPSFKQLAPWFIFFDPNTVGTGNPTLRASISDAIRGTYSWKTVQINLQYTYTEKQIGRFQPNVDFETNTMINEAKNFIDAHRASIGTSFPIKINDWWEFRSNWTAQYSKVNDEIDGTRLSFENYNWFMNGSSSIKLPNNFALEISGTYFSPSNMGSVVWQDFNTVDVGVQKEFANNGGTLKFAVSDIFKGGNWIGELDNPDIAFQYQGDYIFSERVFRLTYSKRFGNSKLKSNRQRQIGSAEEQRRTN